MLLLVLKVIAMMEEFPQRNCVIFNMFSKSPQQLRMIGAVKTPTNLLILILIFGIMIMIMIINHYQDLYVYFPIYNRDLQHFNY